MKKWNFILLLLMLCGLCSCQNHNNPKTVAQQLVAEWTGKQVLIPDKLQCSFGWKDTAMAACTDLWNSYYKVLLYVHLDSGSCSNCKVRFFEWKLLMEEADSLLSNKLSFIFLLSSKSKKDLRFLLRSSAMNYPVFIDTNGEINRLNNFPSKTEYQCFLLDKNNKVLLVGNPTLNPKIWKLYKEVITGKKAAPQEKTTAVEVDKAVHDFGAIKVGGSSYAVFRLKNTGDHPLIINHVLTSCGCASAEWDKQPVAAGQTTEVRVEMKPTEAGFFSKTVAVHCNAKSSPVRLTISGTASSK
ncbi:MAG: DUF1573 domain-containing protein [Prevotellaceae bacterium]|jgi:hypothetical protein|nr:DUF1573 domain-containing protein [Prevotellaceae bacterium]